MKKLLVTLAAVLVSVSALAQGTVNFNNRSLTSPTSGAIYNAPITGNTIGASAQLFLVTGTGASTAYTPIPGLNTFRPSPNQQFFTGSVVVNVPGVAPGVAGTRVVVRAWQGASYDAATERGQSNEIVLGPLGGIPASGPPVTPPDLNGLDTFAIVPEPSTIALGVLGAAALLFRRRK